ncbi:hypothetical protein HMN09_00182100 [Mycena chlorophos]|uniref:Threonine/serine exporter-like N-terminal domain-containing protein n=1 Tax=Mycena chlorophos TaxID=658473 RepID=A0A8H6WJJ2_MYCCL|nr:hypothetical protein HMN09_00182100 [Mycena chlorophos]
MSSPKGIMAGSSKDRDSGPDSEATKTSSGTKTPRKVQWLDVRARADGESGEESMHELDEHGNDPNAFQNLTDALERHSSGSPKPKPRIHYFPPRRPTQLANIDTRPIVLDEQNSHSAPTTATTSPSDNSRPPSPLRKKVPGAFIDPHESAGLPGTGGADLNEHSANRAAAKVVRAHTRKGFFGGFGHRSKHGKEKAADDKKKTSRKPADAEQSLDTVESANPRLAAGGGVLSALLSLYNDQTATNSEASTPAADVPFVAPPRPAAKKQKSAPAAAQRPPEDQTPLMEPLTPPSGAESVGPSNPRTGTALSATMKNILPQKPQRNSAGVLGALIASTGNITGAAAPTSSQLAPNIKRPGYHLSRYSLDEDDEALKAAIARTKPSSGYTTPARPVSLPPVSATDFGALPPPQRPVLKETASMSSLADSTFASKRGWTDKLRDMEAFAFGTGTRSGRSTPSTATDEQLEWLDEKWTREQERKKRERRKRKKAEVYITRHVAQIIQRQEFILKLARALMMFGAPSHRLQTQIQQTGRVLDIQVNCMYLPDVILISFDDSSTGTSNLKFIRQGSALNLAKLIEVYELYWNVIHDDISVSEASAALDALMRKQQEYAWWQLIFMGGMCSASICSVGFNGSFVDSLAVFPLGALLVAIQLLSVRNELYSNVFEITVATLFSFVAAALAQTGKFCYSAVASSAVVLILPGFIVLCGALEIMSRNIVSGSVRMCYAVVYSLFLGFGLAIGAEAYERITSNTIVGGTDYTCSKSHHLDGPWWQQTPSLRWAFLTVPMYSLFLSLRNFAPWRRREFILLVVIAAIGWTTNHFSGLRFQNQNSITAGVGAFTVGVVANMWARFFSGNAFVIMASLHMSLRSSTHPLPQITGILFQLPSGLGNGGLLNFVSETTANNSTSYLSGFQTGLQLISVAIGMTVGLGISLALVHPIPSRRRGGAVFSL